MSGLDTTPLLIPSYAASTSFSFPTTTPTLLSPEEQLDPFSPTVIFRGAPIPQSTFDYTGQYHQHHQNFPAPSQHYPHHHHTDLPEESSNDSQHTSRKRPRVGADTMPCLPFGVKWPGSRNDEKSPGHEYPGDGDERCTTFAGWFGSPFVPRTDYGPPPCKQPIPSPLDEPWHELTWS